LYQGGEEEVNVNLSLLRGAKQRAGERTQYLSKHSIMGTTGERAPFPPTATHQSMQSHGAELVPGLYCEDYCILECSLSIKEDRHDVVVVASTNQVGQVAAFAHTINSNDSSFTVSLIPSLGVWSPIFLLFLLLLVCSPLLLLLTLATQNVRQEHDCHPI